MDWTELESGKDGSRDNPCLDGTWKGSRMGCMELMESLETDDIPGLDRIWTSNVLNKVGPRLGEVIPGSVKS
jgi:hypothetical protein